ncbi:hypothetical protein ACEP2J_15910 [Pseudomonas aeruginosa]|uniref:hypothetical protein n=2 Tax=Pseudomonas aeruginosa TaxID=287 RepID=UPI0012954EA3|nr:hypothetical protein [Pseudomonas aeruginosa]MBI7498981.1 hypothetical protein [Pseudomonas aeruginosa]MBI8271243.1 hypothetical protein [Pseudomonas aeruginosa]MBI8332612.1 hypothetical protein [Pseudomonas aeruginosa]HCF4461939.1 hypothetical protein [Pseudomonas aeruginosa]HEJ4185338.1 hypothetical protein [Pseudomonas aeruginosa]
MDFYMVRRLFLIGALLPATAMADNAGALTADLMKKIDSQCSDYAEILTEARWGMALKATKSKAEQVPGSYRDALFKLQKRQCEIVQQIQMLKVLRESTTERDWVSVDGDATLKGLYEKLDETVKVF